MTKRILIDAVHLEEVRVALLNDSRLEEFDFESSEKKQIKSNIYLGKVTRVEPSLQAAFIEYGGNKQGFLPFSEIHYDYYQIPVADKEKLLESQSVNEDIDNIKNSKTPNIKIDDTNKYSGLSPEEAEALRKADELEKAFAAEENIRLVEKAEEVSKKEETAKIDANDKDDKDDNADKSADEPPKESDEQITEETANDLEELEKSRNSEFYKQYKIQEVLKRNQIVLVQVIKEERGNKGASLTTYVSLAGRYCVLMPNTNRGGGVSRRILDLGDRRRLKAIVSELDMPDSSSIIVRTAGVSKDKNEITQDFEHLISLWNNIREQAVSSQAPAMIHEEGNLIKRSLRDMYRDDVTEVLVEGAQGYKTAQKFMSVMANDHAKKIKEYKDSVPIFKKYTIDGQLDSLYDNEASLKSGGSIVITPTEALVSIDVNSGRSTRGRSIEETAVKTNMEAAVEIARQLRLRDLAGLVVIDFIDMRELRNRRAVEKALKDALAIDRARIQVGRISMFGLMEMSRQRMRSSIVESSSIPCKHCSGAGVVRSDESISLMLLRAIEAEANKNFTDEIKLQTSIQSALYLLNNKRDEIAAIEKRCKAKVIVKSSPDLNGAEYSIDKPKTRRKKTGAKPQPKPPSSHKTEKPINRPQAQKAANKHIKVASPVVNDDNAGNSMASKEPNNIKKTNRPKPVQNKGYKKPLPKKAPLPPANNDTGNKVTAGEVLERGNKKTSDSDSSKLKGLWKKITK